jgi:hypothetical protein
MLVAGEPFGHLRDLLLLLFNEGAQALDRLPRVLGGDAGTVAGVAAPAGGDEVRGLRCGACEDGIRWWTVVAKPVQRGPSI